MNKTRIDWCDLLGKFSNLMTFKTDRLNFEPIFFIISLIVVIFFSRFVAIKAMKFLRRYEFPQSNGVIDGAPCLNFQIFFFFFRRYTAFPTMILNTLMSLAHFTLRFNRVYFSFKTRRLAFMRFTQSVFNILRPLFSKIRIFFSTQGFRYFLFSMRGMLLSIKRIINPCITRFTKLGLSLSFFPKL